MTGDLSQAVRARELQASFKAYYFVNLLWLPGVLVFLGIWILTAEPSDDWAIAAVVMLVVAGGILYLLRRAIARFGRDAMTVDMKGIDHWTWGRIPWHDIESVELSRTIPAFSSVYMLMVKVRRPENYLGKVNAIERLLRTKSFSKTTSTLELLLNGLTQRPERICDVATALLESQIGHH